MANGPKCPRCTTAPGQWLVRTAGSRPSMQGRTFAAERVRCQHSRGARTAMATVPAMATLACGGEL
jgi:hypothetical protein